jgi:hypothetical protein
MKMTVFWDVAPCSLVEIYLRFRGAYCLNHQGNDGRGGTHHRNVGLVATSQKIVIFIFAALRTWNLMYLDELRASKGWCSFKT